MIFYLNNRVFLLRNYRLIVAARKFDVLKTNICPRSNLRSGVPYIFCRGGKVRLIQLLDYLSVASPESGLFSDWSRKKRVLRTEP